MASLSTWFADFRDLLFPRLCAICGKHLNTTEQKLCCACLLRIPYLPKNNFLDNKLSRHFWGKFPIERAHALFSYNQYYDSQRLLMKLKYHHRPDLAHWVGRLMANNLKDSGFFEDIDCIIPIPLHWIRQISRGYNQSLELAKGVHEVTGIPVKNNYVRRIRNNEHQARKTGSERLRNAQNLFMADEEIPYKHILIIDDVVTTGATITSCAKEIYERNPKIRFSVLVVART